MKKPKSTSEEPSWLQVAAMAHARDSLAVVRRSNVLELDNSDPFGDAALQEMLRRVLKTLASWHPRNAARVVELALRGGLEAAHHALVELITDHHERGEPLNSALTTYDHILKNRDEDITFRRPRSRPRESPLAAFVIVVLIVDLLREFPQLRLHRSSARHPSACSVMSAVLIEARLGRGGEGAIHKLFTQYGPPVFLAAVGGQQERQHHLALLKKG